MKVKGGGKEMRKKEKTGWKEFLRPNGWKMALSIILLVLYIIIGIICQPTYADFNGVISSCSIFFEITFFVPVFLAFEQPLFLLSYLILSFVSLLF